MPHDMTRRRLLLLAAGGGMAAGLAQLTGASPAAATALTASAAAAQGHPRIYTDADEKDALLAKIANSDWAKNSYAKLEAAVAPLADRHRTDPEWVLSRMSMYREEDERYTQVYVKDQNFDYGEGNAPVPTLRLDATRIWNSNKNPALDQRLAYSDGSMVNQDGVTVPYAETGHMIRLNNEELLSLAQQAAFLHWVSGDEKYAAFASDIYWQWLLGVYYMKPMLDPAESLGGPGGYEPGGICGYYDYEVIHDPMGGLAAVVYDLLFDYLDTHPHPHAVELGKSLTELSTEVFKRFIDIGLVRGGATGNWNVNGWACIMPAILALEPNSEYPDSKGREHYLTQYTTTSTEYHQALPDILTEYDEVTGLWHESPGYSLGTVNSLLDFAPPVARAGTDTIADNDVMRRASLAIAPWLDARGNMVVFGDGRGGPPSFTAFERLLAYYTGTGDEAHASQVSEVLNNAITAGQYSRDSFGWLDIVVNCDLVSSDGQSSGIRTAYSAHHRHITLKNTNTIDTGLMATLYGGYDGNDHLNPNGLAVQFYGQGWALSPQCKSYESYWSADYAYSKGPAGANTIVPGYTQGPIKINAMEPAPPSDSFTNTTEISAYAQFADVSADEKRRMVAIIRTSTNTGYYVDVFRSDQADNDYLHHALGQRLALTDSRGHALRMAAADDLGTAFDPAYSYFSNPVSAGYDGDLNAVWTVEPSDKNPLIEMRMWMLGQEGRTVYKVDGPGTTDLKAITPNGVNTLPGTTPGLIVRQKGNNASSAPFVSVFEPTTNSVRPLRKVETLAADSTFVGLRVRSDGSGELKERVEYILSATDDRPHSPVSRIEFAGTFGVVCTNARGWQYLYLGRGWFLQDGDRRIASDDNQPVSAGLTLSREGLRYSADAWVRITLPCEGPAARSRIAYETDAGFVVADTTVGHGVHAVTARVPAGQDVRVKIVTGHRPQ